MDMKYTVEEIGDISSPQPSPFHPKQSSIVGCEAVTTEERFSVPSPSAENKSEKSGAVNVGMPPAAKGRFAPLEPQTRYDRER